MTRRSNPIVNDIVINKFLTTYKQQEARQSQKLQEDWIIPSFGISSCWSTMWIRWIVTSTSKVPQRLAWVKKDDLFVQYSIFEEILCRYDHLKDKLSPKPNWTFLGLVLVYRGSDILIFFFIVLHHVSANLFVSISKFHGCVWTLIIYRLCLQQTYSQISTQEKESETETCLFALDHTQQYPHRNYPRKTVAEKNKLMLAKCECKPCFILVLQEVDWARNGLMMNFYLKISSTHKQTDASQTSEKEPMTPDVKARKVFSLSPFAAYEFRHKISFLLPVFVKLQGAAYFDSLLDSSFLSIYLSTLFSENVQMCKD